jgi:hypothetical protein
MISTYDTGGAYPLRIPILETKFSTCLEPNIIYFNPFPDVPPLTTCCNISVKRSIPNLEHVLSHLAAHRRPRRC